MALESVSWEFLSLGRFEIRCALIMRVSSLDAGSLLIGRATALKRVIGSQSTTPSAHLVTLQFQTTAPRTSPRRRHSRCVGSKLRVALCTFMRRFDEA
jgi:hypothetical protein